MNGVPQHKILNILLINHGSEVNLRLSIRKCKLIVFSINLPCFGLDKLELNKLVDSVITLTLSDILTLIEIDKNNVISSKITKVTKFIISFGDN